MNIQRHVIKMANKLLFQVVLLICGWFGFNCNCVAANIGIEYRKLSTPTHQIIHILEIDPNLIEIKLVRGKDFRNSRETVVDLAKHYKAIAAVNGGFFRLTEHGEALPAGLLKSAGKLYGIAYKARAALGWDPKTKVTLIDRIQTKTRLTSAKQQILPFHGINGEIHANKAILYGDNYDRQTLAFQNNAKIFSIQAEQIQAITYGNAIQIPTNGYVYAVGDNLLNKLPPLKVGGLFHIESKIMPLMAPNTAANWQRLPNILNGAGLLLYNKQQVVAPQIEGLNNKFWYSKYARTAVGILANGNWLVLVAELNHNPNQLGLTIPELSEIMQQLGCCYALNLDGGGSSTMYYNNKLVNQPFGDEDESLGLATIRKVSDALVFMPKIKP